MPRVTIMTPLKMAAKSLVDGNEAARNKFLEELNKTKRDDLALTEAMEFLMESSDGDEPFFDEVFDALVARSKDGLKTVRDLASSMDGSSATHLANKLVTSAQKSDFFLACKKGDAIALEAIIMELGASMASKIVNERGQTGFHIACGRQGEIDSKLLKVFRDAGFDEEARDVNGMTPLLIAERRIREVKSAFSAVEKLTPSSSPSIRGGVTALNENQNSQAAAAA